MLKPEKQTFCYPRLLGAIDGGGVGGGGYGFLDGLGYFGGFVAAGACAYYFAVLPAVADI